MLYEPEQINNHVTNHFHNLFSTNNVVQDLQVENLTAEVIPNLISEEINKVLTMLPTPSETHKAVMAMNKNGAPSPDGFGRSFYQNYSDIVKEDVIKGTWILFIFLQRTGFFLTLMIIFLC